MATAVTDDPDRSEFEIALDGERVGHAAYKRSRSLIAFTHTEISPEHGGKGLAGTLIAAGLDAARADGLAVLPFCPFVRAYIEKHPAYLDLVPVERRHDFDLPDAEGTSAPPGV
jgi:predicted GNAT family acetyltransferase